MNKYRSSKWAVLAVSGLALFTDMVMYGVIMPIIKELLEGYTQDKSESSWMASSLVVVYAIGLLIFTPIFGSLSDKYQNRRVPMLVGQAGLAVSTLIFAFANSFTLLLIARFLQGVAAAATWVVGMAMMTDVFSGPNLGFYMSIVYSCHTVGFFLGPLIGGFLHDYISIRAPFYVCTVLVFIDFLGRLWIVEPKKQVDDKEALKPKQEGLSIWQLLKSPEVVLVNAAIMLKAGSYSSLETLLEKHLHQFFQYEPRHTSLVFLAFILPTIVMSYVVGWLSGRVSRYRIMTIGMIAHVFLMPLVCSEKSVKLIVFGGILYGVSCSLISTPGMPELANIVDSFGGASYARVYAILNMCYSLGMIFGPSIVSVLRDKFSFMIGMIGLNSAMLIFAPIFYLSMRGLVIKRRERLQALNITK